MQYKNNFKWSINMTQNEQDLFISKTQWLLKNHYRNRFTSSSTNIKIIAKEFLEPILYHLKFAKL